MIAETPVDLLRHVEVVAAKAGLDVGDRVVLLRGDEEQARVELTSPTTTTTAGSKRRSSGSNAVMIRAVCSAWLPEPTPR